MRYDHKHLIRDTAEGGKFLKEPKGYNRIQQKLGLEQLPKFESMSKKWDNWDSRTAYRGAPLKRFLLNQVGRPWDDVWSDICHNNDSRNHRGRLVRDNVSWTVMGVGFQRDYHIVENKDGIFYVSRHGGFHHLIELSAGDIYVSPSSGLLCCYKSKSRRGRKGSRGLWGMEVGVVWSKEPSQPGLQYRFIHDEWYEVMVAKAEWTLKKQNWTEHVFQNGKLEAVARTKMVYPHYYDTVSKHWQTSPSSKYARWNDDGGMLYPHLNLYAANKRQLNGREIKRLRLYEKLAVQREAREIGRDWPQRTQQAARCLDSGVK